MRNHTSHVIVPPVDPGMFPQREFPPFVALERVQRLIDAVVARQRDRPPNLDRLQTRVAAISERLISLASGQLRLFRWYRRIAVSIRLARRAQLILLEYVQSRVMSDVEASRIDQELSEVIDALHDALAHPGLPDDITESFPSTTESPLP
jgi:hypothetical protein